MKNALIPLQIFGATVRKLREEQRLSQEAFADLCGLHRTYIGGIERGERNIGLLNVLRIAKALGVEPGELLVDFDQKVMEQLDNLQ
ncbi:MAG TPA: helix-turn-helix transcriptional regulator [Anaerolineae bacterium]|mgnify:CR=1 FL=1|nr:helix-turn-helix transcriptional regulator [Anaerolineae bacterium]HQI83128.1 helix-turn-helix transcriptional regulator [Anaerolineae bacterium]